MSAPPISGQIQNGECRLSVAKHMISQTTRLMPVAASHTIAITLRAVFPARVSVVPAMSAPDLRKLCMDCTDYLIEALGGTGTPAGSGVDHSPRRIRRSRSRVDHKPSTSRPPPSAGHSTHGPSHCPVVAEPRDCELAVELCGPRTLRPQEPADSLGHRPVLDHVSSPSALISVRLSQFTAGALAREDAPCWTGIRRRSCRPGWH